MDAFASKTDLSVRFHRRKGAVRRVPAHANALTHPFCAARPRFCVLVGGRGVLIDSRESLSAYTLTLGRFEGFEEAVFFSLSF